MLDTGKVDSSDSPWRLHRILALYVLGVLGFLVLMTWAEQRGLSRHWIGPIFLFLTVMVYAAIGVYGRTSDPEEYYVAGRSIPPMYNGMATAASAAITRGQRPPKRPWKKSGTVYRFMARSCGAISIATTQQPPVQPSR